MRNENLAKFLDRLNFVNELETVLNDDDPESEFATKKDLAKTFDALLFSIEMLDDKIDELKKNESNS